MRREGNKTEGEKVRGQGKKVIPGSLTLTQCSVPQNNGLVVRCTSLPLPFHQLSGFAPQAGVETPDCFVYNSALLLVQRDLSTEHQVRVRTGTCPHTVIVSVHDGDHCVLPIKILRLLSQPLDQPPIHSCCGVPCGTVCHSS